MMTQNALQNSFFLQYTFTNLSTNNLKYFKLFCHINSF
jgi:hypothetical protein